MKANQIYFNRHALENTSGNNKIFPSQKIKYQQKNEISKKSQKKIIQKSSISFTEKKLNKKPLKIINSKTKPKKEVNNGTLNLEDSSTNGFSGNNFKNSCIKKNIKELNIKIEFNIPFLLPTVTETESQFINTKLGENDSLDFTSKKISNEKTYLEKNNKDDSCELFDFNDKTHVDFVLKNFSMLSQSQSNIDKSSTMLEDCNDEEISGNKKVINKVKIFDTKHSKENFMKAATVDFKENKK